MRLINTENLSLEDFPIGQSIPKYAILSHTWGDEEVSFQQFTSLSLTDTLSHLKGFSKIRRCCEVARQHGIHYAWVDTCCIDKTSSAELTESINSMFRWYQEASICFAFLEDVPPRPVKDQTSDNEGDSISDDLSPEQQSWFTTFGQSRWFTRGWTLQELLSPLDVKFFSSTWHELGTRAELAPNIAKITGIERRYLDLPTWPASPFEHIGAAPPLQSNCTARSRSKLLRSASVAQRMHWASQRSTTRGEDMAYCLLGLFDIRMPLIYGEGAAGAYRRLQEEVARTSSDPTLLAWNIPDHVKGGCLEPEECDSISNREHSSSTIEYVWSRTKRGLSHPWCASPAQPQADYAPTGFLAPDPSCFMASGSLVTVGGDLNHGHTLDWSLSSNILSVELPLSENVRPYLVLPCFRKDKPSSFIALPLVSGSRGTFSRSHLPARYVPVETWQQWPKVHMSLYTSRGLGFEKSTFAEEYLDKLWIRKLPRGVDLDGIVSHYGHWTTKQRLIQVNMEGLSPGQPIAALLFRNDAYEGKNEHVDAQFIANAFTVIIRAPNRNASADEKAWMARVESHGSWPWNTGLHSRYIDKIGHVCIRGASRDSFREGLPSASELDSLLQESVLPHSLIHVGVSRAYFGDQLTFAIDIHQSASGILSFHVWLLWAAMYSRIPMAVRIFFDFILEVIHYFTLGEFLCSDGLKNACRPWVLLLRHHYLLLASVGFLVRCAGEYAGARERSCKSSGTLQIRNLFKLMADDLTSFPHTATPPAWLTLIAFCYQVLPIGSLYWPQHSNNIRKNRWTFAIFMSGVLWLAVPQLQSKTVVTIIWNIAEIWQMWWWQNLGHQTAFSYSLLQMIFLFVFWVAAIFVGHSSTGVRPHTISIYSTARLIECFVGPIYYFGMAMPIIVFDWWRTAILGFFMRGLE